MTPKEKAIQLYNNFRNKLPAMSSTIRAKQCALIAVYEMIDEHQSNGMLQSMNYWQEVKQEIERI